MAETARQPRQPRRAADVAITEAATSLPRLTTITGMTVIIAQFASIIWLISTEHASVGAMQETLRKHVESNEQQRSQMRLALDAANLNQDNTIARIDAHVQRLDGQGGRQVGIITSQVEALLDDVRALRSQISDIRAMVIVKQQQQQ